MTSNVLRWRWWWLRPQFRDEPQNLLEHLPWDGDLGHLEDNIAAVAHYLRADLDQFFLQGRQRPVLDRLRRRQRAQEIAEVVGERMKLEPYRVGGKRSARQSRPLDRAFALLDPFLTRPALVVESNDALGRAAHIRHDEADAGIKFSGMPLDLGDNPPRLGPGSGLIAEIGMEPPDFIGRSSDRTLEQVANPTLQDLVGRQSDRILDPLRFEKLVDLGHGEGCIGSKIDARDLASIALHDRVE